LVLIASEASVKRMPGLSLKPEMPLSVLAKLPLIVPSRPNAFRILIDTELDHLRCKPQIVLEVDGLNAILELVGEGLGFAVLPPYTLSNFQKPHTFTTHKLHSPQLVCELMLVTSARRPSTETHKGVQTLVSEVVKQAIEGYS
jgi:LysR family nitrogen assimilation transcriptional regulator